jgi:hypothetical protein
MCRVQNQEPSAATHGQRLNGDDCTKVRERWRVQCVPVVRVTGVEWVPEEFEGVATVIGRMMCPRLRQLGRHVHEHEVPGLTGRLVPELSEAREGAPSDAGLLVQFALRRGFERHVVLDASLHELTTGERMSERQHVEAIPTGPSDDGYDLRGVTRWHWNHSSVAGSAHVARINPKRVPSARASSVVHSVQSG